MAKAKPATTAAPAGAGKSTKTIQRKKRNALERKCLPKSLKVMFAGSDRPTFRALLKAWQESRRKTSPMGTPMGGERQSRTPGGARTGTAAE